MIIDDFYDLIDKSNFYLGTISQVYRNNSVIQIENLSLLSHRKIKNESLIPNTINYLVMIDSIQGLFLGEVFQSKVPNSISTRNSINEGFFENVYPEISVDIIAVIKNYDKAFRLPEFLTVGITDKVYLANEKITTLFMQSIEINNNIEKHLPPFARFLNWNNDDICLKLSTLFNRHLLTVGSTNSGKSTSALSILNALISSNKKILIIDPTGEYAEAFNNEEITKIELGIDTFLPIKEISISQWALLFEANSNTQGPVLSDAIRSLRYQKTQNINEVYVKKGKEISTVEKELSMLETNNTDFNIKLLSKQVIEEAVKESSSKYIYDSFRANLNRFLSEKIDYQLYKTSLIKFFKSENKKQNLLVKLDYFFRK